MGVRRNNNNIIEFVPFSVLRVPSHRTCLRPANKGPLGCTTSLTRANGDVNLLASTVENLKKGGDTSTHADVQVSLRALDVIVQVVAEGEHNIASILALVGGIVTSLKKEGSITVSMEVADTGKLGWRVLQVGVASRGTRHVLAELVQEHVAKDDIILIIKVDGEDDNDAVTVLLEPDGLVGTVVDLNDLATSSTLRSLIHHLVEDGCKEVAGHAGGETRDLSSISLGVDLADSDSDGDIVLGLGAGQKAAVDLLEVLLTTVGLNLIPALARDGNVKLALVGPQMPDNLVEICDCDIDFLSLLSDELGVDDIVNDAVVSLKSQRGCHFL